MIRNDSIVAHIPAIQTSRGMCACLLGTCFCVLATGCVSSSDRAIQAQSYPVGKSEDDIVRSLGAPDNKRAVNTTSSAEPCHAISSDSRVALEYFLPRDGVLARVRRTFGLHPSTIVVVCLDASWNDCRFECNYVLI